MSVVQTKRLAAEDDGRCETEGGAAVLLGFLSVAHFVISSGNW